MVAAETSLPLSMDPAPLQLSPAAAILAAAPLRQAGGPAEHAQQLEGACRQRWTMSGGKTSREAMEGGGTPAGSGGAPPQGQGVGSAVAPARDAAPPPTAGDGAAAPSAAPQAVLRWLFGASLPKEWVDGSARAE